MSALSAEPIYVGRDFYVPMFEVKLRGRPLGLDVVRDITQVTYRDSLDDVDGFEITINNWDAERRDFKYSDHDLFDPGKKLQLSLGYRGGEPLRQMISGEITSLKPNFPAGGQPTLAITGLNVLHTFRRSQVSHAYVQMKDSEIAQEIAGRLSVDISTPATASESQQEYVLQDNAYDIVFLLERARRIGYDLVVEEDGTGDGSLLFGPSLRVRSTPYRLSYGKSLIQFEPTLTTTFQVGKVTVRGWDNAQGKKIEGTATLADLQTQGVGSAGGQQQIEQGYRDREEVITNRPVRDDADALRLARETLQRIAKDLVRGSGSIVGVPDLRAGSIIQVDGVGTRFAGRYFVTSTTHTIGDSGYTTEFDCRREEL